MPASSPLSGHEITLDDPEAFINILQSGSRTLPHSDRKSETHVYAVRESLQACPPVSARMGNYLSILRRHASLLEHASLSTVKSPRRRRRL